MALFKDWGDLEIVAEDLGIIDDGVRTLLKETGYPGMKVFEFAFDGDPDNDYLPSNITDSNCVAYTGTHDNDTLVGLINSLNEWDYNNLVNGVTNSLKTFDINIDISDQKGLVSAIIALGTMSKANLFVVPMQDILGLDTDYRINEPGTVKDQNWAIKFDKSQLL